MLENVPLHREIREAWEAPRKGHSARGPAGEVRPRTRSETRASNGRGVARALRQPTDALARHSHVMSYVFDEGLALFAGLNVIPKRSFLTEYSCRIDPACYPEADALWFDAMQRAGLGARSAPSTWTSTPSPSTARTPWSRSTTSPSAAAGRRASWPSWPRTPRQRVFCYANAELRKDEQNDEILRFVEFWKERTGRLPEELIFDSKLTTYANLNRLNQHGHRLHHPATPLAQDAARRSRQSPASAWRRIELESVARAYRTPRILDEQDHAAATTRARSARLTITDLGHEEPTLAADQPAARARPGQAHRPLRPADDHRERHRRRHRLLPHGRPVLGRGHEGQLRPATDPDGQQPLPAARARSSATATRRPSPATSSATSSTPPPTW